jgi:hypothetical protein
MATPPEANAHANGHPALAPGERVLVHLLDATAVPVVATTAAIYLDEGDHTWRRLGWVDVARVAWDPRQGLLRLHDLTGTAGCEVRLDAAACPPLVALARERFGATLLTSARVSLHEERTAVVTARRVPGSDDVTWVVRLDDGADPDDPVLRKQVVEAIRRLRAELGI